MEKISEFTCWGGKVAYYEHQAQSTSCTMQFSIFIPPNASFDNLAPCLTFLSGLTCTAENFTTKAGAYRLASQLGLVIIAPDTSPRGDHIPDAESYDIGQGAGFYLNATQPPWAKHYQMESYIVEELNSLICGNFPVDKQRQGIFGHSMGGYGALTLFLKYPQLYKSVSAFAPIVAPTQSTWGEKIFSAYLGDNRQEWLNHDPTILVGRVENAADNPEILIDQGRDDQFLETELKPEIFRKACDRIHQPLRLRYHQGYDHSYFFIQTFIDDHLKHHHQLLL